MAYHQSISSELSLCVPDVHSLNNKHHRQMEDDLHPLTRTCNSHIFFYEGQPAFLLTFIGLSFAVLIFLIYKMMRLCSIAFSYNNFHVHQTYKLYALAIINIAMILLSRKAQLEYRDLQQSKQSETVDISLEEKGYQIINEVFGLLSIFTTNYLQVYNGFTWLLISLSCDFSLLKQPSLTSNSELAQITEDYQLRRRKEGTRRLVGRLKMVLCNFLLLGLMVVTLVGTFEHRKGDHWCTVVGTMIVLSSFLPLGVFGIAMYYYAGRFWDPDIPLANKLGLVYLLLVMVIRILYFLVLSLKELSFGGNALNLVYTMGVTLLPIIVMSLLGEMQLKQEQYTLLRRSSLIFKSTVI